MDRIDETEEEAEDRFEADALMALKLPHRPLMPRAATCEKTLRDLERAAGGIQGGRLPKRPTMPTMPRIMSSASVTNHSASIRKRRESVISNMSNMDFTGSNLYMYLDVSNYSML